MYGLPSENIGEEEALSAVPIGGRSLETESIREWGPQEHNYFSTCASLNLMKIVSSSFILMHVGKLLFFD